MLAKFELKNIALVDYAEIDFTEGVNILSGETGSGKSVILDSINFVLGAKADKTMIRYGTDECSASVTFILSEDHPVHKLLADLEIDDDTLIISRRYNLEGRGGIKVNGLSVTANMLKQITSHLVDVHGQSEHFSLLKEEEQLGVLDGYFIDKITPLKEKLVPAIAAFDEVNGKLRSLGGNESERAIRQDILKFQITEIENAALYDGEEEEVILRRQRIVNAEKIINALNAARAAISEDNGAADAARSAYHSMGQISSLDGEYDKLYARLDSAAIELEDIADSIGSCLDSFDFDKDEAEKTEERLETIKRLKKKYGKDIKEILAFLESAREEYDRLVNFDKLSGKLVEEKAALKKTVYEGFCRLHSARVAAAKEFSRNVENELKELGMGKARFEVKFADFPEFENLSDTFTSDGVDSVEFMFSANLGEPLKPLAKIISGGEISRFMLAVRTQTAKAQDISTFIFDEIDSGISGVIASVVAEKFAKIALDKQIIAITHLPQIACMADNSLLIEKHEEKGKTVTTVRNLSKGDRVREITRLVGGTGASAAAVAHANEMIAAAD
ncbi:MAG: DNA repair protein RecN, partial [Clostridia bacterium]|nr:DNA repair protein RecN [Clostridia bacterium]